MPDTYKVEVSDGSTRAVLIVEPGQFWDLMVMRDGKVIASRRGEREAPPAEDEMRALLAEARSSETARR